MKAKTDPSIDQALEICRKNPEGVTQAQIQSALNLKPEECLTLVNTLLQKELIDVLSKGSELVIKEKDAEMAVKLKNLTAEDMLVYQAIKASNRQGIWSRDIKRQTNLAQTAVGKVLKTLETRELVKSVKSVNDGKRKIFVLFDVEPANELTGGLWFQGNEMDTDFINILRQQCNRLIEEKGVATVKQLQEAIEKAKILNVPLDEDSINAIVQTLQYDGVVEQVSCPEGIGWRIAGYQIPEETSFTSFPCGTCPVIEECTPGGQISPEKCIYFDQFLQF